MFHVLVHAPRMDHAPPKTIIPDPDGDVDYQAQRTPVVNDEREATELGPIDGVPQQRIPGSIQSSNAHHRAGSSRPQKIPWYHGIQAFWKHYIHLAVPHTACRDHLGIFSLLDTPQIRLFERLSSKSRRTSRQCQ